MFFSSHLLDLIRTFQIHLTRFYKKTHLSDSPALATGSKPSTPRFRIREVPVGVVKICMSYTPRKLTNDWLENSYFQ